MSITQWNLNGLDLRSVAYNILTTDGWDSFPALKTAGIEYAFTHGENIDGRRFYQARDIDLNMVILAGDADDESSLIGSSSLERIEYNIEKLLGALHNSTGPLTLTKTLPSGAVRTALVRPIDFIRFTDHIGISRAVTLTLRMGYPFWHGDAFNFAGISGTYDAFMEGNAPVNDMIVTFTTAGKITHDATGDFIESSEAGLVVNVANGKITSGDSADFNSNRPWMLQLEPGSNPLTITGGAKTIAGYHAFF